MNATLLLSAMHRSGFIVRVRNVHKTSALAKYPTYKVMVDCSAALTAGSARTMTPLFLNKTRLAASLGADTRIAVSPLAEPSDRHRDRVGRCRPAQSDWQLRGEAQAKTTSATSSLPRVSGLTDSASNRLISPPIVPIAIGIPNPRCQLSAK
jgi:hypothetical protein